MNVLVRDGDGRVTLNGEALRWQTARTVYVGWRCRFCGTEYKKIRTIVRHCRREHSDEMSDPQWLGFPSWVFDRDQWEWRLQNLSPSMPDVTLRQRRSL